MYDFPAFIFFLPLEFLGAMLSLGLGLGLGLWPLRVFRSRVTNSGFHPIISVL